jgi:hypothetical protein
MTILSFLQTGQKIEDERETIQNMVEARVDNDPCVSPHNGKEEIHFRIDLGESQPLLEC